MGITRDSKIFNAFLVNYWEYYRELENEFLQTRKYVEFSKDNFSSYSVEYLKLFQAICSEIDVVGKALAKAVNESSIQKNVNNIYKWWYEIQDIMLLTDGPFTFMNPSVNPKRFLLSEYRCLLMGKIEIHPWQNFYVEKVKDSRKRTHYRPVKGDKVPSWWSEYNKVKHNRMVSIEAGSNDTNYPNANLGNVCNALAALYILEKAFMDMVGTRDDLSCFMDFSTLFVKRGKFTIAQMDELYK